MHRKAEGGPSGTEHSTETSSIRFVVNGIWKARMQSTTGAGRASAI